MTQMRHACSGCISVLQNIRRERMMSILHHNEHTIALNTSNDNFFMKYAMKYAETYMCIYHITTCIQVSGAHEAHVLSTIRTQRQYRLAWWSQTQPWCPGLSYIASSLYKINTQLFIQVTVRIPRYENLQRICATAIAPHWWNKATQAPWRWPGEPSVLTSECILQSTWKKPIDTRGQHTSHIDSTSCNTRQKRLSVVLPHHMI